MSEDLSVAAAAEALGTSPQTVRTLLRKGDLRGHKVAWGSRYVWAVSPEALDEFLTTYGRLDGHRRSAAAAAQTTPQPPASTEPDAGALTQILAEKEPRQHQRPFVLRPRGRATVVVILVGVPLLVAYAAARLLPGALWFDELGQDDVFTRLVAYRADFYLRVAAVAALVVAVNLVLALRSSPVLRTRAAILGIVATSIVLGTLFGSAVDQNWQTYVLWRHQQPFGVDDPIHGKDVGFFVFSLPFHLFVATTLLWLLAISAVLVGAVYVGRGRLGVRPLHATFDAQLHLACITALFLLVIAWRLRLAQYSLMLGQPSPGDEHAFAGAGYVDLNVRSPALAALTVVAMVLAAVCVALPFVAGTRYDRPLHVTVGVVGGLLALGIGLVGGLTPTLVQRYLVDPNPLLSEQPYVERSIAATRAGLGLADVDVEPYAPEGSFTAADFPAAERRLSRVPAWDTYVLGARMQQLVSDPPYYRPDEPVLDPIEQNGRTRLTAVSARELDLSKVPDGADSWSNNRLGYTHGLGLVRFSSTEVAPNRQPRLLDGGLQVPEPRIYFGDLPVANADDALLAEDPQLLTPTLDEHVAESSWVLANTRRPEVDIPVGGAEPEPYHYDGSGGIAMSSWVRRAVFALALGSKELLLSDDITDDSRLLLHRDVHDRLSTLAPFITWDSGAVPLTTGGRVVYVVDGYTTSANYPYAQRVALGGAQVNYARASVTATVDAFDGDVRIYVTDDDDPILAAWQEILPTLFTSRDEIPVELRSRLRYPADLFVAQADAYERFHTTSPDVFVSNADVWSRPIALSGPIDVAGDIDFDEDDEDDLRLTMPPVYIYAPPPGRSDPSLLLSTYYSPGRGQNLVAALSGWIDEDGRPRLAARTLPRDSITLGPAQVSRIVFASPRVRNLLGLRNLEIRDLDRSSIDSVLLGRPRIVFLPGGLVQIQNLYEGSRGPGAARLLGVTAYVNGRAGLGPDAESAVRQALNEPPKIDVVPPPEPAVVNRSTSVSFHVENARRQVVTIIAPDGRTRLERRVSSGLATVDWVPGAVGPTVVKVQVFGLDGTTVTGRTTVRVLARPPSVHLIDPPTQAVAGRAVRIPFRVAHATDEVVTVSTREGIVFERRFDLRNGRGLVTWTPQRAGPAVVEIRTHGRQGQLAIRRLRLDVTPRQSAVPPTVTIVQVPSTLTVGRAGQFTFRAAGCLSAAARIEDAAGGQQSWRFTCPSDPARFTWTPTKAGRYTFTVSARAEGTTAQASMVVQVGEN